jgi:hypothetical protein
MPDIHDGERWSASVRLDIGRALLESAHDTLIPRELAAPSGRDASNVKDVAEAMQSEGLLRREKATRPQPGPGRKAQYAYGFAAGQREAVQRLVPAGGLGSVGQGHHLVFADASRLVDLFNVLADPFHTKAARWGCVTDGAPPEYVVAFPPDEVGRALELMAVLEAAEIACRRIHVAAVMPIAQVVAEAQVSARAAQRVRLRQGTRRAAGI